VVGSPRQLIVKIDPATGIRIVLDARRADSPTPQEIDLDMEFAAEGGEGATPYEVLLRAAIQGDSTQFTRQDSVEETWRILQPLISHPPDAHAYPPGSWGPKTADRLTAGYGPWRGPWLRAYPGRGRREAAVRLVASLRSGPGG
jgi:glucose-6-phosphate 1-dehydrogenase